MKIFVFVISAVALVMQVLFLFKNFRSFLLSWRKRKLNKKIIKFQEKNTHELTIAISSYSNLDQSKILLDIFDMCDKISAKYLKDDVSRKELNEEFIKLKSAYGEYLPSVKKEIRNKNIDSILNNY